MAANKRNDPPGTRAAAPSDLEYAALENGAVSRPRIRTEKSMLSRFRFVFRHLWVIGLSLAACLLIAIGYMLTATRYYQSKVILQVVQQEVRSYNTSEAAGNGEDDLRGDDVLNTITQSLKLDSLYERVVKDPVIQEDTNIIPAQYAGNVDSVAEEFAGGIKRLTTVNLVRDTRLIEVAVENPVPEAAQKLATSVVNQYVAASAENDISTSSAKRKFLLDEVDRTKISLQKSEDGLQIYREALTQKQRVDDQQKVVDNLSQRYLDAHPKLIEARSLLAQLKLGFDAEVKKIIANNLDEAAYWAQDRNLHSPTPDERIASELKLIQARTSVLQSEVDTEKALFDSLLKQMRDNEVQTGSAPIEVKVVDPANLPKTPSRPNAITVFRNCIAGGLFLGLAIVFVLQRLDSTFGSAEEVEQQTDLPVLVTIPLVLRPGEGGRFRKKAKNDGPYLSEDKKYEDIVLIKDPSGAAAESIRGLWATLELAGKEEDRRTTLFSSALPSEGKTFTSCNYAVSLAQHGLKTLLIDADLRRPGVHTRFHLKNDRPGFTEHVAKGMPLSDVVHANVVENLDIMLTGGRCPNPAEFFGGKGFIETVKGALLKYDRVVIDSPPIIPVCDTRLIVPYVQTICLVVKAESTSRHAVQRAINFLESAHVRPVGIIYNCLPSWSIDEYHGYNYSQKYKYGEAYG